MKLSQKADYALRAMIDLARHVESGKTIHTGDIARREGIPEKFLELIIVELRKAGLVKSTRGAEGGHKLAKPADQLTVGEIWRAIDGPILPAEEGAGERPVSVAAAVLLPVWKEVEKSVREVVDFTTLEDLRKNAEARRSVLDYNI